MAFSTGTLVIPVAALLGPTAPSGPTTPAALAVVQQEEPAFGTIESLVAGTPPTTVVVVYEDGSRVQYDVVGSGATSVLYQVDTPSHGSSGPGLLVGSVVQPSATSGIPNPGGRLRGVCVAHFNALDPNGALVNELVVVKTPLGFLVTTFANVVTVPGA